MKTVNYLSKDLQSKVELNKLVGSLTISGRLISLYPSEIWSKFSRLLDENTKSQINKLTIHLDYINTGNVIELVNFIRKMNVRMNNKIEINWNYDVDNEDIKELGEDIRVVTKVPFFFHSIGELDVRKMENFA